MLRIHNLFAFFVVCLFVVAIGDCQSINPNRLSPEEYFGGTDSSEAYLNWVETNGINYDHSYYMPSSADPANGAAIHWRLDEEFIHLSVAVKANGWVGFGIAESGGMLGADVVVFEASRPDTVTDKHILDIRFPFDDESQDWEFVSSTTDDGFLIFEAKRALNTNDPQDRPIVYDGSQGIAPTRIIAAWGDDDDLTYHALNRARSSVRFYGTNEDEYESFQETMTESAEGSFEIRANDYVIPERETIYERFCFYKNDIVDQGVPGSGRLYLVGFEPIVDAAAHVHHYLLRGSRSIVENENPNEEDQCTEERFFEIVYVWAPGEGPLALPEEAAAPFFGDGDFQSFQLEVHYDNAQKLSGVVDNSGLRLYYTSQPRQYEIGVLTLGDVLFSLTGSAVGQGLTGHSFECPSTCSGSVLDEPLTVVREYLHMHKQGVRIENEQIRDGELFRTGYVDYWDFNQQGNQGLQQEQYEILPGDIFRTKCYYRGDQETEFGIGSDEEMCLAFLFYYPAKRLTSPFGFTFPWTCGYDLGQVCNANYEVTTDISESDNGLGRVFGILEEIDVSPIDGEAPGGPIDGETPEDPIGGKGSDNSSGSNSWWGISSYMYSIMVLMITNLFI